MSKVTYHKSHSFKDKEGNNHTLLTQLYEVGVYGIFDNDPALQGNFEPKQIVKIEKHLKKLEKEDEITELKFNSPITITDESGLWKEVVS